MESDGGHLPYEAWAAHGKGKTAGKDSPRMERSKSGGANEVGGDGQVLNGLDRRTGERNCCYTRGSEYHLASRCLQRRQGSQVPSAPSM